MARLLRIDSSSRIEGTTGDQAMVMENTNQIQQGIDTAISAS